MKILVTAKSVADPYQPITINADGTALEANATSYVINPFDAIAVEEASRIREQGHEVEEIVVVGIGSAECEKTLRTALAMGADRAVWVESDTALDPWGVTRTLLAIVDAEKPDLVIMGKQAVDDDSNQVGQFLAGLLGWPQATFASKLELTSEGRLRVEREADHGIETLAMKLPAVVTCDLRLNEPRYTALPAIMKAKRKPLDRTDLPSLGVSVESRVKVLSMEKSSVRRECQYVDSVDELMTKLRDEAKAL